MTLMPGISMEKFLAEITADLRKNRQEQRNLPEDQKSGIFVTLSDGTVIECRSVFASNGDERVVCV
jgi:hypothetical protein